VTTTKYDGLLIDVTDPLLKHTLTQLDTLSRPVTITDAANGKTKYKYGPIRRIVHGDRSGQCRHKMDA
jgi:YD repeat-containing protein